MKNVRVKTSATTWFGESWGAPINENCQKDPTPVGAACLHCEELISEGNQGVMMSLIEEKGIRRVPLHLECHMRSIVGSVGHLTKQCSCYGGNEEDPKGMTKREAAKAAYALFISQNQKPTATTGTIEP